MLEIFIKDLVVEGKHGVNAAEKLKPQRFKISVRITLQGGQPHKSDELNDTVNWSATRQQIIKIVQATSFDLIERLAQAVTDELMADKRIKRLVVKIEKMDAFPDSTPGVKLVTKVD